MPVERPPKGRIVWQDTAKGLGILLVVFGHMERGLMSSGILPARGWAEIDFALYTFHMPLFMLLSGLNVPQSLAKGTGRFVRSKVLTILYPYVLWSLFQGVIMAALGRFTNTGIAWTDLLLIGWRPISPFWFLYALFLFMLAAAYLPRMLFLVLAAIAYVGGEFFSKGLFIHQILHFPIFFVAGIWMGERLEGPAGPVSTRAALACLVAAAVTIAAGLAVGLANFNSVLMLPAAIGGIGVMLWISRRLEGQAWLAWIGQASMAIYVMHVLTGAGFRILMSKGLHVPPIGIVYLVACSAAGLAIPLIAYVVLRRIRLAPLLGLGLGPRGRAWINGEARA